MCVFVYICMYLYIYINIANRIGYFIILIISFFIDRYKGQQNEFNMSDKCY